MLLVLLDMMASLLLALLLRLMPLVLLDMHSSLLLALLLLAMLEMLSTLLLPLLLRLMLLVLLELLDILSIVLLALMLLVLVVLAKSLLPNTALVAIGASAACRVSCGASLAATPQGLLQQQLQLMLLALLQHRL